MTIKDELYNAGLVRVKAFCEANSLPVPDITDVPDEEWSVGKCAYYRPGHIGIRLCIKECAWPSNNNRSRNWNWPGSTTDREPYGVLCHELGHHADWHKGVDKGLYWSEYSTSVMQEAGDEKCITSYCDNNAEWFAEMFRLFITNHALLKALKPKTHDILTRRRGWKPVSNDNWKTELAAAGFKPPTHIVENLEKKISQVKPMKTVRQKRLTEPFDIDDWHRKNVGG